MSSKLYLLLSALIGAVVFAFCGGLNTLHVTDISYLMAGDPAQHWVGWEFFRHTPLLQWPIGNNVNYGIELNNSIVYTDSIPIFAVLFKLFAFALPETFQYTGIWLLLCFVLQGVTSFILIEKLTHNRLYALLASIIFAAAVPFIHRTGGHFALSAHWLIIASLCLYFNRRYATKTWLCLLLLASWVHAYILAMMLIVWMADLATRVKNGELKLRPVCFIVVITGVALYVAMYAIGYFTISNSFSSGGYGYYKLNLNSLINPYYPPYSSFIKPMPAGDGEYEGINYLGFGVLLMLLMILFIARATRTKIGAWLKPHYILIAFCVMTACYALSNNIALGTNTLVEFYIPKALEGVTKSFRASGRFFWVVYYIILVAAVIGIYRLLNKRNATLLLLFCAFLHIYDIHHIFKERRKSFSHKNVDYTMTSPEWAQVAKEYKKVLAVDPWAFSEEYVKWAYFVSTNNMAMNFGYFARFNGDSWNQQTKEIESAVDSGKLDPNAIYLFKDKARYENTLNKLGDRAFSVEDNGVYAVALKKTPLK